jgi:predicted transposase YbfD/YdcC
MSSIPHTIRLKDGQLCNLNKRIAKQEVSLLVCLQAIPDPRKAQGKRHELTLILLLVFVALLRGSKDLKDAHLWALHNRKFLARYFLIRHGLPDPTTISRVMAVLDPDTLVTAFLNFLTLLGVTPGQVYSFDGKTIRAVASGGAIRHMLSFFSHDTHLALGQVGVSGKENEIPAFERLLGQTESLTGCLLLGDALHTQKATCKLVLRAGADYLFVVKNNQRQLKQAITAELTKRDRQALDTGTYYETERKRQIVTTVTAVTAQSEEELLPTLTRSNHWDGVQTMGLLHRTGTRTSKDGVITQVDELIGFISSSVLSAEQVAIYLRHHWCIENNLHWVKDEVFGEDKHTLRKGNAPQVMSFLRSMAISLCNVLRLKSISDAMHNLEKSPQLHCQFLTMAAVV